MLCVLLMNGDLGIETSFLRDLHKYVVRNTQSGPITSRPETI